MTLPIAQGSDAGSRLRIFCRPVARSAVGQAIRSPTGFGSHHRIAHSPQAVSLHAAPSGPSRPSGCPPLPPTGVRCALTPFCSPPEGAAYRHPNHAQTTNRKSTLFHNLWIKPQNLWTTWGQTSPCGQPVHPTVENPVEKHTFVAADQQRCHTIDNPQPLWGNPAEPQVWNVLGQSRT